MQIAKKTLSVLLAVLMVMGMFAAASFTASANVSTEFNDLQETLPVDTVKLYTANVLSEGTELITKYLMVKKEWDKLSVFEGDSVQDMLSADNASPGITGEWNFDPYEGKEIWTLSVSNGSGYSELMDLNDLTVVNYWFDHSLGADETRLFAAVCVVDCSTDPGTKDYNETEQFLKAVKKEDGTLSVYVADSLLGAINGTVPSEYLSGRWDDGSGSDEWTVSVDGATYITISDLKAVEYKAVSEVSSLPSADGLPAGAELYFMVNCKDADGAVKRLYLKIVKTDDDGTLKVYEGDSLSAAKSSLSVSARFAAQSVVSGTSASYTDAWYLCSSPMVTEGPLCAAVTAATKWDGTVGDDFVDVEDGATVKYALTKAGMADKTIYVKKTNNRLAISQDGSAYSVDSLVYDGHTVNALLVPAAASPVRSPEKWIVTVTGYEARNTDDTSADYQLDLDAMTGADQWEHVSSNPVLTFGGKEQINTTNAIYYTLTLKSPDGKEMGILRITKFTNGSSLTKITVEGLSSTVRPSDESVACATVSYASCGARALAPDLYNNLVFTNESGISISDLQHDVVQVHFRAGLHGQTMTLLLQAATDGRLFYRFKSLPADTYIALFGNGNGDESENETAYKVKIDAASYRVDVAFDSGFDAAPPPTVTTAAFTECDSGDASSLTVDLCGGDGSMASEANNITSISNRLIDPNELEFLQHKEDQKKALEEMRKEGDSAESKKLIDDAIDAIDAVEYNYTISLADNKQAVDDAVDFTQLKSDLTDQRAADAVEKLIDDIGKVEYTDASKDKIDAAREAFNDLTDAQKALVPDDVVEALTDAEDEYELLDNKAQFEEYKDALIQQLVEKRRDDDSPESQKLIDDAIDAINKKEYDETQPLEGNKNAVDVVVDFAQLDKDLTDQRAADAVEKLIDDIGKVEYTDASKDKIDDARAAYNDLTDAQKALVPDDVVEALTDAEDEYELLDNKAQFEEYKDELIQQLVEKRRDDDSPESQKLIDDAIDAINKMEYDEAQSFDENMHAVEVKVDAEQLDADLAEHREIHYAEFYADGTLVESVPYTIDTKSVTEPAVPGKTGHSGVWSTYTLKVGGTRVDAVYTPDPQTVQFDPNGGEGEMEQVNTTWGSTITLPECAFTAANGKEFDKWDAGDPGDEIEVKSDLTVKAIWKEKPLTITADVDPTQTGDCIAIRVPYTKRGEIAATLTASEDGVYYESSKPEVISVDENGTIRLEKLCLFCRTATITAYSASGEKVATCEVRVEHTWWQILVWLLLGSFWY